MKHNETIRVCNLSTGYRSKKNTIVVARGINASLRSGELTCLLGPNGAGKSTLLRTLSAFQPALEGEIRLMGVPLTDYTEQQLATTVGIVLTERCDIHNMTVEALVGMGRSPYTGFWGKLSRQDKERVDESMEWVKIGNLRNRMVQTLSDGERQKVMIAKALAQETPVIFLDEPTAFLDYPSKVEIMQLLHRIAKIKDKTIFLSTHDMELALQIADQLWLMDKQKGIETGNPEDLSLNGSLERFFRHEGIVFDREEGLFRIDRKPDISLRFTGEGTRFRMARKALLRNGIQGNPEAVSPLHIHVTDNYFTVNSRIVHTVGDMLREVENHLTGKTMASQ